MILKNTNAEVHARRRRTNVKKKDIFERMHLIRRYHWWVVYEFSNPNNYPKYWDRSNLPDIPSDSEEEEES